MTKNNALKEAEYTMLRIEDYDVTPDRGFLTPHNMDEVKLPADFSPLLEAGKHLSDYMETGRVQHFLKQIPEIDMKKHLPSLNDAQLRMLMVHYSFIVQAYVWGEKEAAKVLPRNLAVPYCLLADKIGQFPLLPYTAYTLDNWGRLDKKGPITLENIYVIQNFLDGQDENWFIMVHIEIEAKAGRMLAQMPQIIDAVKQDKQEQVIECLEICKTSWQGMNASFARMPEKCDPYIYYNRVRPYIHGWKGNPALPEGLIYEGVGKYEGKPQAFRGQTGSQSSIVPTVDALLQISHEDDPLRSFLDELHQYRPPKHRMLIEEVQKMSKLRDYVIKKKNKKLTQLYNDNVTELQNFRGRHLEYAASYINKQAAGADGNPVDVGTGGTPFMKYLKKHKEESTKHLLPLE